jgi:hypothetical protein
LCGFLKNSRTRRVIKYASIKSTIGIPITALGSVPEITLNTSPGKFTAKTAIAVQRPQRAPRHNPIAATAQAVPTTENKSTAQIPIAPRPGRPRGLSFHIGSRKPLGTVSEIAATIVMTVATTKKILSAVTPKGRGSVDPLLDGISTSFGLARAGQSVVDGMLDRVIPISPITTQLFFCINKSVEQFKQTTV